MMSRFILPALMATGLAACAPSVPATPTPSGSNLPSTSPSTAPGASQAPTVASPTASAATASAATAASAYSAKVAVDGKPLSLNPNDESPLYGIDSPTGLHWAFGISRQGGPADQAAAILTVTGKKSLQTADFTSADVSAIKLQVLQNSDSNTAWTLFSEPSADFSAARTGGLMTVHIKGKDARTSATITFDATGVRLR